MSGSPAFVLVHGAWHGGWCYRRVAERLRLRNFTVFTPTLTGLADRSHLLTPQIDLNVHAADIVNLANWEELDNIVLCGHSYGGAVITAAAEQLDGRLRALVFLDAVVPQAGTSLYEAWPQPARDRFDALAEPHGGALIAPISASIFKVNEQDRDWVDRLCTPHPFATFKTPIASTAVRDRHPRKIYVVASGYSSAALGSTGDGLRDKPGWEVFDLPFGHELMIDAPAQVTELLLHAAR